MEEAKSTKTIVIESVKEYLSNPNLSMISNPSPWLSDFVNVQKFSKPQKEDIFNRAKENIVPYMPNYLIIMFVFLVLGV